MNIVILIMVFSSILSVFFTQILTFKIFLVCLVYFEVCLVPTPQTEQNIYISIDLNLYNEFDK